MALERRNPLPPGRYSILVIGPEDIAEFDRWLLLSAHSVRVEKAQAIPATALESALNVKQFTIFHVDAPVIFESKRFGFPDKAGPEVQSVDDTVQQPDPEEDPSVIAAKGIATGLMLIGGALGGLLLFKVLSK